MSSRDKVSSLGGCGLFSSISPMSKKTNPTFFGIKADGVTFLFKFPTRSALKKAKAGAKRIGLKLSEVICSITPVLQPFTGPPKFQLVRRKFTHEDRDRKPRTV